MCVSQFIALHKNMQQNKELKHTLNNYCISLITVAIITIQAITFHHWLQLIQWEDLGLLFFSVQL